VLELTSQVSEAEEKLKVLAVENTKLAELNQMNSNRIHELQTKQSEKEATHNQIEFAHNEKSSELVHYKNKERTHTNEMIALQNVIKDLNLNLNQITNAHKSLSDKHNAATFDQAQTKLELEAASTQLLHSNQLNADYEFEIEQLTFKVSVLDRNYTDLGKRHQQMIDKHQYEIETLRKKIDLLESDITS